MIAYFDTSAIVKFYISETGSDIVREAFNNSEILVTSEIAYVEAISAFIRINNEKLISDIDLSNIVSDFKSNWEDFFTLKADINIIKKAGFLIEKYKLRSYDSIHLSSAVTFKERINKNISFYSWDKNLNTAALNESLQVLKI